MTLSPDDLAAENIRRAREQEADGSAERRRQQMQEAQRVRVRADGARVPIVRNRRSRKLRDP